MVEVTRVGAGWVVQRDGPSVVSDDSPRSRG